MEKKASRGERAVAQCWGRREEVGREKGRREGEGGERSQGTPHYPLRHSLTSPLDRMDE